MAFSDTCYIVQGITGCTCKAAKRHLVYIYNQREIIIIIKITKQGYAPPVDIVSKLLLKVSDTSCYYFNRQVFAQLEKALILEQKYDMLDPKLMIRDSVYPTYGSVGICSLLQH